MDLQLTGKTVFITGASGGIGRALARTFADEGCNLALHANSNLDGLREFIAQQSLKDRALAVQADITDAAAIQRAMARDFRAPVFWYIILICYPHVTHTIAPAPAPLLLCEPEHYAMAGNKVTQRDILVCYP